jgi:arylsulfatase A-like enzyme
MKGVSSGWPNVVFAAWSQGPPGRPPHRHPDVLWGIRFGQYKYIETVSTGETELYDLKVDPYELNNVARRPQYAVYKASLARRLLRLRTAPPH